MNDLSSPRQLDTEGQEQLHLFSQDGVWWVNSGLGRKMGWSGWLRNRKDAATPPPTGWEYQRWQRGRGGFWENDTSLLLRPGPLEPCPRVTVATGGGVREAAGRGGRGLPACRRQDERGEAGLPPAGRREQVPGAQGALQRVGRGGRGGGHRRIYPVREGNQFSRTS